MLRSCSLPNNSPLYSQILLRLVVFISIHSFSVVILLSFVFPAVIMKKNKSKACSAAEKEFVFEFRAGKHSCLLKVPLQFPVQENINDLHGRLMLLHKIPCYIENGEIDAPGKRKDILGQVSEMYLRCYPPLDFVKYACLPFLRNPRFILDHTYLTLAISDPYSK